ncbi:hypothetical protein [Deinococcus sp. QL22]|uniref:hypothetical protein n=1 Tax=Deinococcus sp. QL22 TaxID=2939437 RepID=UPI002016F64B|nr:hypothetical protein [Deinococcus sp. QL22]UQN09016.1 hypothetical protein M1R55_21950 [Deinococcus sp. QL22]
MIKGAVLTLGLLGNTSGQVIPEPPRQVLLAQSTAPANPDAGKRSNQGKSELSRTSLQPSTQQLIAAVKGAVEAAGGDLERNNVHLVLAFSTGHYKSDPLGAQAARELATQLVQGLTVSGDQVTSRAWEMTLWPYRNSEGLSLRVGTDKEADQERIRALWPTTPAVGSIGGHDTEQAVTELATEFAQDAGAVLVLLTNTAASVGAPGARLLGSNAPSYQAMLERWTRIEGTQDGATLNVPYVVTNPAGDIQGQLQAVVFAPKTFTTVPLTGGTRTELLAARTESGRPQAASGGFNAVPLLIGLLLLGGGFFLWRKLSGGAGGTGGGATLRVADQTFSVSGLPKTGAFCVLAGPGYISEGDTPVVPVQGFPPERVAELSRQGREIKVRGVHDDLRLSSVAGRVVAGDFALLTLRAEQPDWPLEFNGEVRGPSGVPRDITRTVSVSLTQGEV